MSDMKFMNHNLRNYLWSTRNADLEGLPSVTSFWIIDNLLGIQDDSKGATLSVLVELFLGWMTT